MTTWLGRVLGGTCITLIIVTGGLEAQRRQVGTTPWTEPDAAPWRTAAPEANPSYGLF
ncbi:MAG: hypothetical protein IH939_19160 [Acidobacteria bacterium]|nr:hypothetical protein [Acidobacteriota bacterium]